MTPPRWIVFGGSFDPPHRAHVQLPRRAAEAIGAERVLYVPARLNPLKQRTPPASAEDRLAMLRLAIADDPHSEIRTLELDREGPSYTAHTLRALADEAAAAKPPARLVLLVGSDTALGFPKWRTPDEIARHADVAVMMRPPHDEGSFHAAYENVWRTAGRAPAITPRWVLDLGADHSNSTGVRAGEDETTPLPVRRYIEQHDLYRR
ncbi:MAG: nicotinate (nicotinamide) nucleotide adenylyltransferase [Phycisphaerales bacterium]|jgi:nicotinate-nucleotide adenylyltransferase